MTGVVGYCLAGLFRTIPFQSGRTLFMRVSLMQVDLSGLRALVTGSTKGIGRAIAEALAENGAEVAINGRKAADVERTIAAIRRQAAEGAAHCGAGRRRPLPTASPP
jgi:shikimate 5-dehydrogenase